MSDCRDCNECKDEGTKHDEGKLPLHLIPPEALVGEAKVLAEGAKVYGEYNWAKGMAWSRLYRATVGHLLKWWCGINIDKDSRLRHLYHARANVGFLIAYEERKIGVDDRPQGVAVDVWDDEVAK